MCWEWHKIFRGDCSSILSLKKRKFSYILLKTKFCKKKPYYL